MKIKYLRTFGVLSQVIYCEDVDGFGLRPHRCWFTFNNWQYIMKRVLNYLVCSLACFVAIVFVLSGSLVWTLCGLAWCLMLYVWGVVCPKWWKMFWVSNLRILAYFNCL